MSMKDRLIQYVFRGKDELSPEARKIAEELDKVRSAGKELTEELDKAKGAQGLAQTFKTTSDAADRAKSQWEAAEKRAQDLRAALDRAPSTKGLTKGLKDAEKSADAARGELQQSEKDVESLRKQLETEPGSVGVADSLTEAEKAAEAARAKLAESEQQVEDLRKQLDEAPGTKGLEQSLRAADREAAKAAKAFDELTAETQEAEAAAQAAGVDTRNLASEQDRLAREVSEAADAVQENAQQVRELEREQRAASKATEEHTSRVDSVKEAMDSAGKKVLAFAAAYVSLNAAFGLAQKGLNLVRDGIRSMLETGSEFELMQQRVTGLMGSIEEGERATAWISDFAKQTGQLIPDVTEAFALLKAYGLDPMDGSLKAITDKSVQLGGGMERLSGITAALGQMWAKQKIQQEEVLQLTERGVVVWPLLEKAMGKTTAQLQDMAQKGELGRDAVKLLIDEIGKSAEGAAAEGLDTLQGKLNGLRNSASEFLNRIAESGAMEAVKDKLTAVADEIDRLDQDGTLDNLAQALSNAFVQGIEKVEEFARSLGAVDFNQLANDSAAWLNDFGSKIDSAVEMGQTAGRIFTGVWHGFRTMVAGAATALFGMINLGLGNLLRISEQVADAVGMDELAAKLRTGHELIGEMQKAFAAATVESAGKVAAAVEGSDQRIVASAKSAAAERVEAVKSAADQQRMLNQALADHLVANQQRVKDAAIDAAIAGTEAIEGLAQAIKLIDTSSTVKQLEGLKEALLDAYRQGTLSQEEYNNGLNLTNARIKELGGNASATAKRVDELITSMESFSDVTEAIAAATTEMDIIKLGTVIKQMYTDGKISSEEYKTALESLAKEKERITKLTGDQAKAESDLAAEAEKSAKALTRKEKMDQAAADAAERSIEVEGRRTAVIEEGIGAMVMGARRMAYYEAQAVSAAANAMAAEQARVDSLISSYSRAEIGMATFIAQAGRLRNSLTKDGDAFASLESAIASAESQMRSMANSTRSTLDGLRDELDRLRGDEEAIEQRRMENRRRDLQSQLAEARAAGNDAAASNLSQALSLLRTIEAETARIQSPATQATAPGQEEQPPAAAPATTTPAEPAPTPAEPTTVIRLESAAGSSVNVAVPYGQEDALLSILEQSGMRTI